ncbi:hypothetical protein BDP27DRAFT_1223097 [Rhodocollybia butyracea]|uniref:Tudor domain-containing protein n=1 Tax=Rhodocollybia butyracea TaxID=206335 RepID=A0A9P5U6R3_9AGAR|nr:hypothetical protein BDP27DRAFT_1223097 [Rhodocollybia butyracea]
MERADLETYQVQLSQVEAALQAEPDNIELASLRDELQELINLTQQALAQSEEALPSKAESSRKVSSYTPTATWSAGDECMAKYSSDGAWYPARITSVGGSEQNRVYTVVFKGYNSTEQAKASDLKPLPLNYSSSAASLKRKHETDEEKERKKKKNEKKLEIRAAKAKEQNQKQATWQKFAKKSEKKKNVHIAGVVGTSIFKTPDNPLGKVGVTGSGNGMTPVTQQSKHKFAPTLDDNP